MRPWLDLVYRIRNPAGEVRIAVVGKYVQLEDAYKSLREALIHGGLAHKHHTIIEWIEAEEIDSPKPPQCACAADGILVPGGFGKRGIQGMIYAISTPATHKVPFFGICLGHAMRDNRICARCGGTFPSGQHRIRSADAASRHLQIARTARRRRNGRHHAPRRVALQTRTRLLPAKPTAKPKSASATATATNLIATTKKL